MVGQPFGEEGRTINTDGSNGYCSPCTKDTIKVVPREKVEEKLALRGSECLIEGPEY